MLTFHQLFNSSPIAVAIIQHHRFQLTNPQFTQLMGYSANELLNMHTADLVHPDDRLGLFQSALRWVNGEDGPAVYEFRTVAKNGDIKYLSGYFSPVEYNGEKALLGQYVDLTDKKRMEEQSQKKRQEFEQCLQREYNGLESHVQERTEQLLLANQRLQAEICERCKMEKELRISEARYRGIVEDQADLIVRFLPDGTLTFVNDACCTFYNRTCEELLGTNIHSLLMEKNRDRIRAAVAQTNQQRMIHVIEFETLRGDGEERWLHWTNRGIFDEAGQLTEYQAVGRDITARKKAEENLQSANDELERRVQQRTRQLEQAKEAAEAASRAKSSFLANMSHELRTPLNGIIGMVEYLLETDLPSEEKQCLHSILYSGNVLGRLISDVLDYSRCETERVQLKNIPFYLGALLDDTTKTIKEVAAKKGLLFEEDYAIGDDLIYTGDPRLLRQILLSLLSNAVKFTDQGTITLRCTMEADQEQHAQWRFEVTDTGIGIADEALDTVFDIFVQADSSMTRRFGGIGLGLALAKRLVTLMGGFIGVQSKLGQGSTFWVTLPLEKSTLPPANRRHAPWDGHIDFGLPILLVDDSISTQKSIIAQLKNAGVTNVNVVNNGLEAVRAVAEKDYGLIVMDCQMPLLDGFKATRAIRALEAHKEVYSTIVAVTAHLDEHVRALCLEAGMDGYLEKPFKFQNIMKFMNALF
ncbi:PAS domain-containing hybrid sensor histidine kinase/response regulator [Heliophilum fasciatum]|uniref:Circadian input-output histidine kinase CikA n=1 Tax=Heliophilum fasciatum TaxID=35700 RepID=A0A4R2RVQ0_9FIRM|nr:PAS domain S-box protein [Heliophilum fasciatum]MCW2276984.1 PAS domain S-box-containing protein [Heliophilum fasciatum]TCP68490.1 PAS domain S-box-containing protein [Heliophilum fasciatum]